MSRIGLVDFFLPPLTLFTNLVDAIFNGALMVFEMLLLFDLPWARAVLPSALNEERMVLLAGGNNSASPNNGDDIELIVRLTFFEDEDIDTAAANVVAVCCFPMLTVLGDVILCFLDGEVDACEIEVLSSNRGLQLHGDLRYCASLRPEIGRAHV